MHGMDSARWFRRRVPVTAWLGLVWIIGLFFGPPVLFAEDQPARDAEQPTIEKVPADPSHGQGGATGLFPAEELVVGQQTRTYRLYAPEGQGPLPIVFAFHGLGDTKDVMAYYSQLERFAKQEEFLVVFPNAQHRMWPLVVDWAKADLAFFDALYDKLCREYDVDRNRVYLTGMSNGAYFCHVLASQRSERIAAIAPHSGGIGFIGASKPLQVDHKYAVLAIHGAADKIVNVQESRRVEELYTEWGHPIEYWEIPGQPHFWALRHGVNARMWKFFREHPRQPLPRD